MLTVPMLFVSNCCCIPTDVIPISEGGGQSDYPACPSASFSVHVTSGSVTPAFVIYINI